MLAELIVALIVEALDGRVFDGAIHALDLAVGPRMLWLSGTVLDIGLGAGLFEGMCPDGFARCVPRIMHANRASEEQIKIGVLMAGQDRPPIFVHVKFTQSRVSKHEGKSMFWIILLIILAFLGALSNVIAP